MGIPRAEGATWTVDRLTDVNPSGGGEGAGLSGELRYAITRAQAGETIRFAVVGTIHLVAKLPALTRDIRIEGPSARLVTVNGGRLTVNRDVTAVISGLTLTGGVGNGGGILNAGTLTVNDVIVTGNSAGNPTNGGGTGAGIWNLTGAELTLNRSTVSNNAAVGNAFYNPSRGGGVANYGTLTLTNSTVSGNSANYGFGGGIFNSGTLTLRSSTVADNTAPGGGGGISNQGVLVSGSSIIAGNQNTDLSGALTSLGHNVVGIGGSGFDPTDRTSVDPRLAPLGDNGGATPTMSPLPASPAIDAIVGTPGVDFPSFDQRAVARPQGAGADVGALEVMKGPFVEATVNGSHGPLLLVPEDPLQVTIAFDAGDASSLDPAEVYVALATGGGWFWLDPETRSFVPTLTRLYAGSVPSFPPTALILLPSASVLPAGTYTWVVIVDDDANGTPNGSLYDFVVTIVP